MRIDLYNEDVEHLKAITEEIGEKKVTKTIKYLIEEYKIFKALIKLQQNRIKELELLLKMRE